MIHRSAKPTTGSVHHDIQPTKRGQDLSRAKISKTSGRNIATVKRMSRCLSTKNHDLSEVLARPGDGSPAKVHGCGKKLSGIARRNCRQARQTGMQKRKARQSNLKMHLPFHDKYIQVVGALWCKPLCGDHEKAISCPLLVLCTGNTPA